MRYSTYFRIADSLDEFIRKDMVDMGRCPNKVTIQLMMWRLSNTDVGSELLERYVEAVDNPVLWRNVVAYTLQSLAQVIKIVAFCARSTKYAKLRKTFSGKNRVDLKDEIEKAVVSCKKSGYDCSALFEYIEESRNIMIHSGIIPYGIVTDDKEIGLDSFIKSGIIKSGFDISFLSLVGIKRMGGNIQDKEINETYRSLFFLILASLCFYFDSANPSLSKNPMLRHAGLVLAMGMNALITAFLFVVGGLGLTLAGSGVLIGYLVKFLIKGAITVVILMLIILVASKIMGFFNGSYDTHQITDVTPHELVEWVEEMTPYEQMKFMNERQKAIMALELYHPIGDPLLAPSDSVTERLYSEFKDYPDPKTHPLAFLPNTEQVARIPIVGLPFHFQIGGEGVFSKPRKNAESHVANYLPIYQGDYYPLARIYNSQLNNGVYNQLFERLSNYPKLKILLIYGNGAHTRTTEAEILELAKEIKQRIIYFGVNPKKISMIPDVKNSSGVTVAIGGLDGV